jgi:hypothetical protein
MRFDNRLPLATREWADEFAAIAKRMEPVACFATSPISVENALILFPNHTKINS